MTKSRKRITTILIGVLLVVASLVWMKHSTAGLNPIPAFVFVAGLIAIHGTVKRILLDIARNQEPRRVNENR